MPHIIKSKNKFPQSLRKSTKTTFRFSVGFDDLRTFLDPHSGSQGTWRWC